MSRDGFVIFIDQRSQQRVHSGDRLICVAVSSSCSAVGTLAWVQCWFAAVNVHMHAFVTEWVCELCTLVVKESGVSRAELLCNHCLSVQNGGTDQMREARLLDFSLMTL